MDNPELLAILGTQDKEQDKQNKKAYQRKLKR
jgi:hypothetical protein